MLSVILCSRSQDNQDSNLLGLLDSAVNYISKEECASVEFLIKFDSDDKYRPNLPHYPFAVHSFVSERGEGKSVLNHHYEWLFMRRNPSSRFIMVGPDDIVYTRYGFVSDILAIQEKYCIISSNTPSTSNFMGYNKTQGLESPVMSVPLLELLQNFGWVPQVDVWIGLIAAILQNDYDLDIVAKITHWHKRVYPQHEMPPFGQPVMFDNDYWFHLVKQQAKNAYLNIPKKQYIQML